MKRVVVANERAVRAAAFDPSAHPEEVIALDAWLEELLAQVAPLRVATPLEELTLAAQVIAARGGNPSLAHAREVRARLRQLLEAGVEPNVGKLPRALHELPHLGLARDLASALAQKKLDTRASVPLRLLRLLEGEPLLAASLQWPTQVIWRDIVRLTPTLVALLRQLATRMQLDVELPLIERPFGLARARDALEQLGDRYAEILDGPPSFRAVPMVAKVVVYTEPTRADALVRGMACLGGALDAGIAADACALAWPLAPDDDALRALALAAKRARIPVPEGLRETAARGVDELLRWCELLAGEIRFDELLALLRSPLLELAGFETRGAALTAQAHAARQLIETPLPRGPAHRVLAEVVRESAEGASVFAILAELAAHMQRASTAVESLRAVRHASDVLGVARGASRGGMDLFRQEEWTSAPDRELLSSLAFEERAFATLQRTCEDWATQLFELDCSQLPRGVLDVAMDLRTLLDSSAPRQANVPASVGSGDFAALAAERTRHIVVLDASYDRWAERSGSGEQVAASLEQERLRTIAREAELLLACTTAQQIDLLLSGVDDRGGPPRLHPMFAELASAAPASTARYVLSIAETLPLTPDLRAERQRAREGWRGEEEDVPDVVVGQLREALTALASAARPLSPHAAEQFVACPYRGFVGHELRARAESDAEAVADPSEEGRMLHALLEAAFVAAQPELDRPDPDPSRVRALGMRAAEPLAAPWSVGIRRVQVRRLLVWVSRTLDEAARDREWRFESAELAFGASAAAASSPAPWPALCVQDTWFAGRLDRLDRSRSGNALRVVDYKRSTVSNLRTRLQLPIYAAAAEANDPRAGRAELGVYVVPRRAGGATGVTEVSFAEASATALIEENIVPVLHQLRTGDVAPRPAAPGECQRCDARGVCRRPPFRVHEGPA